MKPIIRKIAKSTGRVIGVTTLVVGGIYWYQPQRYDFFPKPVPNPNPRIDPDTKRLFATGTKVAIVAAHPDDPEFFIGGTLVELGKSGAEILIVMCTDGDKGYYPFFMTNATENRRVRMAEQLEAASHYGAKVAFMHGPDGRLRANDDTDKWVGDQLRAFQPEYVLSFDSVYQPKVQHSDHLQSGIAAAAVVRSVPSVKWLMRFSTRAPNYFADVSKVWDQREKLLEVHKSQFFGNRLELIRGIVQEHAGDEGDVAGVDFAEGFRCTRLASP